jgi:hypothetical protein
MGDVEVNLNKSISTYPHAQTMFPHTLCVILGPLVASVVCAKKTNATDKIRSIEMTNL